MPLFRSTAEIMSLILPVLGILLVTSEWSQRTGLTTFALVPQRERVIVAKLIGATPARPLRRGRRASSSPRSATSSSAATGTSASASSAATRSSS